jgi:hypothetical protein
MKLALAMDFALLQDFDVAIKAAIQLAQKILILALTSPTPAAVIQYIFQRSLLLIVFRIFAMEKSVVMETELACQDQTLALGLVHATCIKVWSAYSNLWQLQQRIQKLYFPNWS